MKETEWGVSTVYIVTYKMIERSIATWRIWVFICICSRSNYKGNNNSVERNIVRSAYQVLLSGKVWRYQMG